MDGEAEAEADDPRGAAGRRLVAMLIDRDLERIARGIERNLGVTPEEADDAVFDAVVRTLDLDIPPAPSRIGAYVLRAAQNRAIDAHRARRHFAGAARDLYEDHDGGRLAEHIVGEDVFRRIRTVVAAWDNANVRAVTLAFLDAT